MISVVIPTLDEANNLPFIVPRLSRELARKGFQHEIIIVDDSSSDGTADVVKKLSVLFPVRIHVRRGVRGLATAVIEGIEMAQGEICVVMDADLSHPIEKVKELVAPVLAGEYDIAVGSRCLPGGGFEHWPTSRRAVSWVARKLARGLTTMSDPNSGFIAFRKSIIDRVALDPIGWKIVLEIVCRTQRPFVEIPFVFCDRSRGESKLTARVTIQYLQHLLKLYLFRIRNSSGLEHTGLSDSLTHSGQRISFSEGNVIQLSPPKGRASNSVNKVRKIRTQL